MYSLFRKNYIGLLLVSFAILFIEMVLVRWVATESRIFAYINNLVLLACFLGIGLGSCLSGRRIYFFLTGISLGTLGIIMTLPCHIPYGQYRLHIFRDIPTLLGGFADSVIWFEPKLEAIIPAAVLGLLATFIIFALILTLFIPLGQILGRLFEQNHRQTIRTYSLNIVASLLGIWCFIVLSFLDVPPTGWFLLAGIILLLLLLFQTRYSVIDFISVIFIILAVTPIIYISSRPDGCISTTWSPYQKLQLFPYQDRENDINRGYYIDVNNIGYMSLINLSDDFIARHPGFYTSEARNFSQYDLPYRFCTNPDTVLILGSGAGNDVAGALRHDIRYIDAVEIDPAICRLGEIYHPERPYSDPRVHIYIDDARSFMENTKKKYDVICLSLLDAHTTSSNYNNIRLDHYIYTKESFERLKSLLSDDGILSVSFAVQRRWIGRRIRDLIWEAFGHPPLILYSHAGGQYGWGGILFLAAGNQETINATFRYHNPEIVCYASPVSYEPDDLLFGKNIKATTDDWPYLYLETARIPAMHLVVMLALALLFLISRRFILSQNNKINFHFFFLGAAFLLLEFQNISKSSLLLGSTWLSNALIISAILLFILAANYYVARFKPAQVSKIYILLTISLLFAVFFPGEKLLLLPYWPRTLAVGIIYNIPVFFAGMIFIDSFRKAPFKDLAFGSNFLGSAFGGLAESLSFIFGIKALVILVLIFYLLSLVAIGRADSKSLSG